MTKEQEEQKCFGEQFDPSEVECAGGYDPNYVDENASSIKERHQRPRCELFEACGTQARAKKYAEASQKHARIITPPAPPQAAPAPTTVHVAQEAGRISELKNRIAWLQGQVHKTAGQTPAQPVAYSAPQVAQPLPPAQMLPTNYGMTSYLSVLEPGRRKRGNKWKSLASETARSIFKASGHSVSYFFDTVPWGEEDE